MSHNNRANKQSEPQLYLGESSCPFAHVFQPQTRCRSAIESDHKCSIRPFRHPTPSCAGMGGAGFDRYRMAIAVFTFQEPANRLSKKPMVSLHQTVSYEMEESIDLPGGS